MSKNVIDATNSNYKKDGKIINSTNEYTKSFCDTEQYQTSKKITEITRDSLYQLYELQYFHKKLFYEKGPNLKTENIFSQKTVLRHIT